jgi:hypothetical protein
LTLFFPGKSVLGGILAALLLAAPVFAQPVSGEPPLSEGGNGLVLDALGQRLSIPAPDWLAPDQQSSGALRPLVETIYRSDETQAILQILPKGEIEALWNTLYGAQITLANRPLTELRAEVVARHARTCKPALTAFFQLGEDQGDTLAPLGFVCGGYRDSFPAFAGKGEIMVMSFKKNDAAIAMVFQEWRGQAFDPATPSTWPVTAEVVETRAKQLQDEAVLSVAVD